MSNKQTFKTGARSPFTLSIAMVVLFALITTGRAQNVLAKSLQQQPLFSLLDSGDILFQRAVPYGTGGTYAYSVAVADVNGDGKPDLLVASCGSGADCGSGINGVVGVLLGNGDGTFKSAVTYDAGGFQTASIAVADLNGDGKPDLVVANSYLSNTVGVLLGNGDGTFRPVITYFSGGGFPWSVAIADVNRDGKADIVVANGSSCYPCADNGRVGVLMGNGDGTFEPAQVYSSGGYNDTNWVSLAVADLNGNGKLDVVVTNACGNSSDCSEPASVAVLQGNGDGTFRPAVNYASGGNVAVSVAVADVNGDGKPDLVVANSECFGKCGSGSIGVLLGNGNGTFKPAKLYPSGGDDARSVVVADLNGDGVPDLAVANACPSSNNGDCAILSKSGVVAVLTGNGDGTFKSAARYGSGGYWYADNIVATDVNGDSRPDLLVVNLLGIGSPTYRGSIGVLLNNTNP